MKMKLLFLFTPIFFLIACSPSNETATYEDNATSTLEVEDSPTSTLEISTPKSYSAEKQSYVQSCIETSDENFCSCQFDVMDPILSSSVGSDWSTKNMEEQDFGVYVSAVESAVSQCS